MSLLDSTAQEQVTNVASVAAKASTAALTGQLIFGYTINEISAIVAMVIAVSQFVYWIYEKFFKDKGATNGGIIQPTGESA